MPDSVNEIKTKLEKVSSSFCLAKWTSVTLHLEAGTTHSCHHPSPHKIKLSELESDPAALHNTSHKLEQRKKMLNGERPSECDYCWRIEDLNKDHMSDRILKSAADWSVGEYDKILTKPLDLKYKPKYLEVSFSNKCQFKCMYCSADYSTTWEEELKKFGPYRTSAGNKYNETIEESDNPYIKAFWDWWPELSQGLHTFRITGGEPLLSPNTFKIIESLLEKPQPELSLAINTNLGAPTVLIEKFINYVVRLEEEKAVKEITVFASIDAYGSRAEYIRTGLKADYFWSNLEQILVRTKKSTVTLMCTFNALSVTSFNDLFDQVDGLNKSYSSSARFKPILTDIAYLRNPEYQSVKVLTADFNALFKKSIDHVVGKDFIPTGRKNSYYHMEIIKLKRLYDWMLEPISITDQNRFQRAFYSFYSQMDERRNTNFCKTFPEMKDFWRKCEVQYRTYKNEIEVYLGSVTYIGPHLLKCYKPISPYVIDAYYFFAKIKNRFKRN